MNVKWKKTPEAKLDYHFASKYLTEKNSLNEFIRAVRVELIFLKKKQNRSNIAQSCEIIDKLNKFA
jgi:hypothetical protein